jgi:hypothetical protein
VSPPPAALRTVARIPDELDDSAAPAGRGPHGAVTAALVALLACSLVVLASVVVVRRTVLSTATFTSALVRADAYERTYTEVLADPELAALKEGLLGRLGLGPALAVQARALATNALRWAVPPSALHAGTATVLDGALAYVRGDTEEVDLGVDVGAVVDGVERVAVTEARTLLAAGADRVASSVEAYRDAVVAFVDELASGRVPDAVPVLAGTAYDPAVVVEVVLGALGTRVDEELRLQVTAAVLAGEARDALVTAAGGLVRSHARAVAEELRGGAAGDRLDVVAAIAERGHRPSVVVAESLASPRRLAGWLGPPTTVVAGALAAGAVAALLRAHRRHLRRAGSLLAGAAVAAGLATAVLWWRIGRAVATPLDRATGTGPDAWGLPPGLRAVLGDVRAEVASTVATAVWRAAGGLAGAGVVVAAAVALATRLPGRAGPGGPLRVRQRLAVVAAAGAVATAATVVAVLAAGRPGGDLACNGHPELCERPYDEVVQAATHNSMSSPDVVQVWPEHDGDLRAQLDAGVRVLLIDTHYWPPLRSAEQLSALDPLLPPRLAESLYQAVGARGEGREGTFLCHNHCAFGGMPFLDGMVAVREFLVDNPGEVVTLVIQDAITPEDTEAVMRDAGLGPFLYGHGASEWPTLGELVDSGQRLVVFAEEAGPPPAWYANAFEAMKETPFLFLSPEQFSCRPNRGDEAATLFLLNHWVQRIAPDRVDSVVVNRLDELVGRARRCEVERGRLPNFLAVNFYNIGDLMAAVDELNGVR